MTDIVPGTFLIAGPGLQDPNFCRSVVLVCEHTDEGSLGVVINRPLRTPVSQVFPDLVHPRAFMHSGGPVETGRVMALRRSAAPAAESSCVFANVSLVVSVDELATAVEDSEEIARDLRFYVGYAGWGRGQLEDELAEGAWITRPGSAALVFSQRPSEIWASALRELGGDYELLAEMPIDPGSN